MTDQTKKKRRSRQFLKNSNLASYNCGPCKYKYHSNLSDHLDFLIIKTTSFSVQNYWLQLPSCSDCTCTIQDTFAPPGKFHEIPFQPNGTKILAIKIPGGVITDVKGRVWVTLFRWIVATRDHSRLLMATHGYLWANYG